MPELISIIIAVVVFCILAFGLNWVCDKFFPALPPVKWACGAFLLILILLYASGQLTLPLLPIRR